MLGDLLADDSSARGVLASLGGIRCVRGRESVGTGSASGAAGAGSTGVPVSSEMGGVLGVGVEDAVVAEGGLHGVRRA